MTAVSGPASEILMAAHCLTTAQLVCQENLERISHMVRKERFVEGRCVKSVYLSVQFGVV